MIGYIKGTVVMRSDKHLIVDVSGIGFEIQMPESSLIKFAPSEEEVSIFTHLNLKDEDAHIYGFDSLESRDMFRLLIGVSGIGPRLALNILSAYSPDELLLILSSGDSKRLQSVSGIGKRTAERLCVDLKEKARAMTRDKKDQGPPPDSHEDPLWEDAFSALLHLGYRPREANSSLARAFKKFGKETGVEEILKEALKYLAKT